MAEGAELFDRLVLLSADAMARMAVVHRKCVGEVCLLTDGGMRVAFFEIAGGNVDRVARPEVAPDFAIGLPAALFGEWLGERASRSDLLRATKYAGDDLARRHFMEALAEAAGRSPDKIVSRERRPAPLRACEARAAVAPKLDAIPRLQHPAIDEFARHVRASTPCLVEGAVADWPLHKCTPSDLRAKLGDAVIGMTRQGDIGTAEQARGYARLGDFLDEIARHEPGTERAPYSQGTRVDALFRGLIETPPYFVSDDRSGGAWMWLGPKGTTTRLHRDGGDNLFAQVWGEKTFLLCSPHERPNLYCYQYLPGLDLCDVDPRKPDVAAFPLAAEVRFVECTVRAGDVLFLPDGWFHYVESNTAALSINFPFPPPSA